ncbi:uncharacterized protein PV09_06036 [Verruconis gallopava]|uniref:Hydrophobin n=1 Tax=Verruconis gallopava TaxID=253628 RepID=A0A0D1XJV9_9PEZI|nr:uncharacterized protein PV09_06036 [Verruconis gallopava]KIW02586.1 hypothetical protein PV09_06036 [Verruconis gallopava]
MQFAALALALFWATSVSASPARIPQPVAAQEVVSTPYTAGDAFHDCQGKGLGDFVCWANEDARSYGKMSASELKKLSEVPMREIIKGPAFCCKHDPFFNLGFDYDFLGLIDIEQRVALGKKCTPIWWWG